MNGSAWRCTYRGHALINRVIKRQIWCELQGGDWWSHELQRDFKLTLLLSFWAARSPCNQINLVKTQLHCIFLQEGKKAQVDVWASVCFSSSKLNHRSRVHLSPSGLERIHISIVSSYFYDMVMIPSGYRCQAVQCPSPPKTAKLKTKQIVIAITQVHKLILMSLSNLPLFMFSCRHLDLLHIDQYWTSTSSHKSQDADKEFW